MVRALELLDITIQDPRWRRRLKELTRARELLCDAWFGGKEYHTDLEGLNRYFFYFALACAKGKLEAFFFRRAVFILSIMRAS